MAEAVVVAHVLKQTSTAHLLLAQADAQLVVTLIEEEEDEHGAETDKPEPARHIQGKLERGWDQKAGMEQSVDTASSEDHGEVGRQEVRFEQAVEDRDQVELVDRFDWQSLGVGGLRDEGLVEASACVESGPVGAGEAIVSFTGP